MASEAQTHSGKFLLIKTSHVRLLSVQTSVRRLQEENRACAKSSFLFPAFMSVKMIHQHRAERSAPLN